MADDEIPGQIPLFDISAREPDGQEPATINDFSDGVLQARLAALLADNRVKHQSLVSQGLMPDPRSVLSISLETLLDLTLTPSERLRFQVLFETRMATFLDQCLAQRTRAELLAPMQQAPPGARGGLIVPPH